MRLDDGRKEAREVQRKDGRAKVDAATDGAGVALQRGRTGVRLNCLLWRGCSCALKRVDDSGSSDSLAVWYRMRWDMMFVRTMTRAGHCIRAYL